MFLLLPVLLLVAVVSAQFSTSFWQPLRYEFSDKIGYVGSVINVNAIHTTYELAYDNGTDVTALGHGNTIQTVTVGPDLFEQTVDLNDLSPITSLTTNFFKMRCTREDVSNGNAAVTCVESRPPVLVSLDSCLDEPVESTTTKYYSITFTFSGRGSYSAGVETIVNSYVHKPESSAKPDWCSIERFDEIKGVVTTYTLEPKTIATYPILLTAGVDKLSATQGASATASSARPTGSQTPASTNSGTGPSSTSTGGAASLKFSKITAVGAGIAIAVFWM